MHIPGLPLQPYIFPSATIQKDSMIRRETTEDMLKALYIKMLKFKWRVTECESLNDNMYRITIRSQKNDFEQTIILTSEGRYSW